MVACPLGKLKPVSYKFSGLTLWINSLARNIKSPPRKEETTKSRDSFLNFLKNNKTKRRNDIKRILNGSNKNERIKKKPIRKLFEEVEK